MLVHAEHATHPHRVETSVMDQAANRLRVDAELSRDLTHAVQPVRVMVDRQDRVKVYTTGDSRAWAERLNSLRYGTYRR